VVFLVVDVDPESDVNVIKLSFSSVAAK
jgi:hypothetical protein